MRKFYYLTDFMAFYIKSRTLFIEMVSLFGFTRLIGEDLQVSRLTELGSSALRSILCLLRVSGHQQIPSRQRIVAVRFELCHIIPWVWHSYTDKTRHLVIDTLLWVWHPAPKRDKIWTNLTHCIRIFMEQKSDTELSTKIVQGRIPGVVPILWDSK